MTDNLKKAEFMEADLDGLPMANDSQIANILGLSDSQVRPKHIRSLRSRAFNKTAITLDEMTKGSVTPLETVSNETNTHNIADKAIYIQQPTRPEVDIDEYDETAEESEFLNISDDYIKEHILPPPINILSQDYLDDIDLADKAIYIQQPARPEVDIDQYDEIAEEQDYLDDIDLFDNTLSSLIDDSELENVLAELVNGDDEPYLTQPQPTNECDNERPIFTSDFEQTLAKLKETARVITSAKDAPNKEFESLSHNLDQHGKPGALNNFGGFKSISLTMNDNLTPIVFVGKELVCFDTKTDGKYILYCLESKAANENSRSYDDCTFLLAWTISTKKNIKAVNLYQGLTNLIQCQPLTILGYESRTITPTLAARIIDAIDFKFLHHKFKFDLGKPFLVQDINGNTYTYARESSW